MRKELLTCLKERIQNRSGEKPVFASLEAHRQWLFGGGEHRGLFRDPATALAATIASDSTRHRGVAVSEEEKVTLREVILGSLRPNMQVTPDGVALCDPAVEDCWY